MSAPLAGNASTAHGQVTVPGDAVRFPELNYYLEAWATIAGNPQRVARWPDTGFHTVAVENVLRMTFHLPDGTPAQDATVVAGPPGSGPALVDQTDSDGAIALEIPATIPYIAQRMQVERDAPIFVQVFTNWPDPTEPIPPEGLDKSGFGTMVGATVNLGHPELEAVDTTTQDETFTLQPQERSFTSSYEDPCWQDLPPSGAPYFCDAVEYIPNVRVPLAVNVGGGVETRSMLRHGHSENTKTTWLYGLDGQWYTAQGELTSEQKSENTADAAWWGPNANGTSYAYYDFAHTIRKFCRPNPYTGAWECTSNKQVYPFKMTIGLRTFASTGIHDQAHQMTGTAGDDCVRPLDKAAHSTVSKGRSLGYQIGVEGKVFGLSATTSYEYSEGGGMTTEHHWEITGTMYDYHHLYVPDGWGSNSDADRIRCPEEYPELTWTDSSNIEKDVASNAALDPVRRHITGGIYHNLYRTNRDTGLDRIHGWVIHGHASPVCSTDPGLVAYCKSVRLWTCDSPNCQAGSALSGSVNPRYRCGARSAAYHVHCDGYSEQPYSTGYLDGGIYGEDSRYSDYCGDTSGTDRPEPCYPDGHGMNYHPMYHNGVDAYQGE